MKLKSQAKPSIFIRLSLFAFLLTGCATTVYRASVYQDGSPQVMTAEMAHDWSGRGAIRFTHFDGEKFSGEYTSVAEEIYSASLTTTFGASGRARLVSVAPSFGVAGSNMFYGVSNLTGDQGSTARCIYMGMVRGWLNFNILGLCKDSRERTYTTHLSSDGGAKFPDEVAPGAAQTSSNGSAESAEQRHPRPRSAIPGREY